MLRLRPYKPSDAATIVTWCKDEITFRRWTSDRYDHYPITSADMNLKYLSFNGDCVEDDNFYPFTAFDEDGIVGHLIMRYVDEAKKTLRLGFVIVDDTKRGKGYGKELIRLSLRYAFECFGAETVNLGVFENNPSAWNCYRAAGFRDVPQQEKAVCCVCGEDWTVTELEMSREEWFGIISKVEMKERRVGE